MVIFFVLIRRRQVKGRKKSTPVLKKKYIYKASKQLLVLAAADCFW
jgi:hypothetical protein